MVIHVYPNCCHKVRYSFLPEFSYAAIQLDINQLIDMNYFFFIILSLHRRFIVPESRITIHMLRT